MKSLILIFGLCLIGFAANAQTYTKMYTGAAKDTLVASQTIYKILNVDYKDIQTLSVHVFVDEISGATAGTATLYKSLDGVNFITTGVAVTWTSSADTLFTLTDTAFYGTYAKFEMVATGATQKAAITATARSWNK